MFEVSKVIKIRKKRRSVDESGGGVAPTDVLYLHSNTTRVSDPLVYYIGELFDIDGFREEIIAADTRSPVSGIGIVLGGDEDNRQSD